MAAVKNADGSALPVQPVYRIPQAASESKPKPAASKKASPVPLQFTFSSK